MRLPNGHAAIIEFAKIRDYCLSPIHLRGRHKARVFFSALGMTSAHSNELCAALAGAARDGAASIGESDSYGTRYMIDFELTRNDRRAMIRSWWIIRSGENVPRFVTCFVR
jgi:uncharacterized protein DUF6883